MKKITVNTIKRAKGLGRISMLTCYDYSFGVILDKAGLDIILVGDSLANVVLGMEETRDISIKEMLNHTRAVAEAAQRSLVVTDMPYKSYQKTPRDCAKNAKRFISAGASAVKIEWFKSAPYVIKRLIKNKIPVMGHIGLTPQTAHLLGGYKVQGRGQKEADKLIAQAKLLEKLGVFSLVLECVPYELAREITRSLKIPTIGIGAGKYCDGQVLVLYDLLGLYQKKRPKFVRVYKDLFSDIESTVSVFIRDIKKGKFPARCESFTGYSKNS